MYCSNDFFCSYNSPLFLFFVAETIILFAFSHQSVDANFRQKIKKIRKITILNCAPYKIIVNFGMVKMGSRMIKNKTEIACRFYCWKYLKNFA